MRSIGTRLTIWYAAAATVSFAVLGVIGTSLLYARLIDGLDGLNAAEFRQLEAHIGSDYAAVTPTVIERRLANVNSYESVLFFVSIEEPSTGEILFQSSNLHGAKIPDEKGKRNFSATADLLGPLRVSEFLLPPYDVTVATSSRAVDATLRAYAFTSAALVAAMLVASLIIGLAMRRIVLRPIRAIRLTADRIGSDNLSERIPVPAVSDEIAELAELLNRTFDRLETMIVQMRRFSEEVSHELKTPLSLLRLHAEQILRDSPEHAEAAVEQIEEIARLNRFIDQMLFLSRAEADAIAFDLKPVDPRPYLETFAADAAVLADATGQRFDTSFVGDGAVAIDESQFRQVLFNLTANAIAVSPPGGHIRLTSRFGGTAWHLRIEDDGPGVAAGEHDRIFDRFVRLAPAATARGTGLGLSISRSIVKLHGGRMWAEAAHTLAGLAVVIELPALPQAGPA